MDRGLALVLAFVVMGLALLTTCILPHKGYFDPALSRGSYPCTLSQTETPARMDSDFEVWFSEPLRAVGEPSLYSNKPPTGATTVRFTFLPGFVEPVIVRIDDLYGEAPRLTAYRVVGEIVLTSRTRLTRTLTPQEVTLIRELVGSSRVLDLPPDSCLSSPDGYICLIEANGPAGYRFINRYGASEGPVYELGKLMFALTGWPNGYQGPDMEHLPDWPATPGSPLVA